MTQVFHLERLTGVDPRVLAFFEWWDASGPFPLTIAPNGGWRTDEAIQASLYAQGRTAPGPHAGDDGYPAMGLTVTNAARLVDTPHGRKGAGDAYPAILNGAKDKVIAIYNDDREPKVHLMFHAYGLLAEDHGLVWGGRWRRKDMPHVEVPRWRDLPIPSPPVA